LCVGIREVEWVLKCQQCEKNVALPFKCPFCGGYFCADHRLPENHACPELWKARTRPPTIIEKYRPFIDKDESEPSERRFSDRYPFRFKTASWTSSTEMLHLTIGTLLVMAVGLSMYNPGFKWIFLVLKEPTILLGSALVFTVIFVFHELAHKIVAKRFGLWAEFRLSLMGAIITLISVAPIPIKFVSPGAVMIVGEADKKMVGIIALAGPFASVMLSALFLVLYPLILHSPFALIIIRGATLSSWIALLNLIPFSILDGAKVFWWNKAVWAVSFSVSMILTFVVLRYLLF